MEAARWYLQLDQFEPDQILERRLAAAQESGRLRHRTRPHRRWISWMPWQQGRPRLEVGRQPLTAGRWPRRW